MISSRKFTIQEINTMANQSVNGTNVAGTQHNSRPGSNARSARAFDSTVAPTLDELDDILNECFEEFEIKFSDSLELNSSNDSEIDPDILDAVATAVSNTLQTDGSIPDSAAPIPAYPAHQTEWVTKLAGALDKSLVIGQLPFSNEVSGIVIDDIFVRLRDKIETLYTSGTPFEEAVDALITKLNQDLEQLIDRIHSHILQLKIPSREAILTQIPILKHVQESPLFGQLAISFGKPKIIPELKQHGINEDTLQTLKETFNIDLAGDIIRLYIDTSPFEDSFNTLIARYISKFRAEAETLSYSLFFGLKSLHFIYGIPKIDRFPSMNVLGFTTPEYQLDKPISVADITLAILTSQDEDNQLNTHVRKILQKLHPGLDEALIIDNARRRYDAILKDTREFIEYFYLPLGILHYNAHPHLRSRNSIQVKKLEKCIADCQSKPRVRTREAQQELGIKVMLCLYGVDPENTDYQRQVQGFIAPYVFGNIYNAIFDQKEMGSTYSSTKIKNIKNLDIRVHAKYLNPGENAKRGFIRCYTRTVLEYVQNRSDFADQFPNIPVAESLKYIFFEVLMPHVRGLINLSLEGTDIDPDLQLHPFFITKTLDALDSFRPLDETKKYDFIRFVDGQSESRQLGSTFRKDPEINHLIQQVDRNLRHAYPLLTDNFRKYITDSSTQDMIFKMLKTFERWKALESKFGELPEGMEKTFLGLSAAYSQIRIRGYKLRHSFLYTWAKINAQNTEQAYLQKAEASANEESKVKIQKLRSDLTHMKLILVLLNVLYDDMGEDIGDFKTLRLMSKYLDLSLEHKLLYEAAESKAISTEKQSLIEEHKEVTAKLMDQKSNPGFDKYIDLFVDTVAKFTEFLTQLKITDTQSRKLQREYQEVIYAVNISWLINHVGPHVEPFLGRDAEMHIAWGINMDPFNTLDEIAFINIIREKLNYNPNPEEFLDVIQAEYPQVRIHSPESVSTESRSTVNVTPIPPLFRSLKPSAIKHSAQQALSDGFMQIETAEDEATKRKLIQDVIASLPCTATQLSPHQIFTRRRTAFDQVLCHLGNDLATYKREIMEDADWSSSAISTLLFLAKDKAQPLLMKLSQLKNLKKQIKSQQSISATADHDTSHSEAPIASKAEEIASEVEKIMRACHIEPLIVLKASNYLEELRSFAENPIYRGFEQDHDTRDKIGDAARLFLSYWLIKGKV